MLSCAYPIGWQFYSPSGKEVSSGSAFSSIPSTTGSYPISGTLRIILVQVSV